ncbi:PoNe immunity protein domain-containing protein [Myroides fluvii]|uniref:PoNe immunity protein domain-containing protein n=1 Tax=Myroides fluvii TaxID=2572594 RepID=UPI00131E7C2B|nr:PoNe immunity protein domain-containing protein [Myroides fluvii]
MNNFIEYIEVRRKRIEVFKKAIENREVDNNKKIELNAAIFDAYLYKTIALYSSEANKELVTASLVEAITAFEDGFYWEGFAKSYAMYGQMVWMLSLGILCEVDDANFKRIVAVIQRGGAQDELLKTLVNYRLPRTMQGSSYIQKSPYAHLDGLVKGQDKSISFIKTYLNKKWYQGHRDAPWYDSHKRTKVNTYFGYWAWEVAALVKIYAIDDEELKEQQYYPYRAVRW